MPRREQRSPRPGCGLPPRAAFVEVEVDLEVYPLDAVMLCGYLFIGRCFVLLDTMGTRRVVVTLSAKPGTPGAGLHAIAGDFQNELLAQAVRHRIGAQHQRTRELLLARALFGAAPEVEERPDLDRMLRDLAASGDVPGEHDDFVADPLGIAVPWEAKHPAASPAPEAPPAPAPAASPAAEGDAPGTAAPGGDPADPARS
jgi:His-Xaa-Ser system protein HxsD